MWTCVGFFRDSENTRIYGIFHQETTIIVQCVFQAAYTSIVISKKDMHTADFKVSCIYSNLASFYLFNLDKLDGGDVRDLPDIRILFSPDLPCIQ